MKNHPSPLRVGVIHYHSYSVFDRLELFTPRCQFSQLFIGHVLVRSALQQKFKVSVNIQIVCFRHLNHYVYNCTGIGSLYGTAEQPVLPSYCKWADRILTEIVCKAAPSVFQIGLCCIAPVENIVNCFVHPGIPDGLLLVEP